MNFIITECMAPFRNTGSPMTVLTMKVTAGDILLPLGSMVSLATLCQWDLSENIFLFNDILISFTYLIYFNIN